MDYSTIRARNHKLVESVRSNNKRASMTLDRTLYSKQGALANHRHQLKTVSKEKKLLEQQLAKIRIKGPTTHGLLPPKSVDTDSLRSSSATSDTQGQRTDEETTSGLLPSITRRAAPSREDPTRTSLADVNLAAAKERVTQRLLDREEATKDRRKSCTDDDLQAEIFNTPKYNPDGSLRTVHLLPDFKTAYKEAKKARYLRTRSKQWFEKELSVKDIFDKNLKEKTLLLFSTFD